MESKNTSDPIKDNPIREIDVFCCDFFKNNFKQYGWFSLGNLGEQQFLMPYILGTNNRINFCPSCGKEVRNIILSYDVYHNT
jgi:hypothetical protein